MRKRPPRFVLTADSGRLAAIISLLLSGRSDVEAIDVGEIRFAVAHNQVKISFGYSKPGLTLEYE
jgi:hypothetical protein